ncbi:glycerol kinase [bacterium]|nr:MAG: glycerol kinase [bacterium]
MKGLVLALDQGTTGTRALVYGPGGRLVASAYREFTQHFPRPGWVEHDAAEIWRSAQTVIKAALAGLDARRVAAVGVTNQRETTVVWDRQGRPLARAVVWQDRRTAAACARLKARGLEAAVRRKTGLLLDPYFSATKLRWLLDETPGLRSGARRGDALFGTVDSWLLWNLTGGRAHATDLTNASRTLLFDIGRGRWDAGLLDLFGVPAAMLPEALPSGGRFGLTAGGVLPAGIPITAMLGDQQAALYGQSCYGPGQVKNTYGTGCFVVANLGPRRRPPPSGLLETLACGARGEKTYALEGSVFAAGAAVQWLRDGLGIIASAADSERLARSVPDSAGVTLVPAFAGLGAPHWRPDVRGAVFGLTRGTTRAHLARATLEAVAHQTADVVSAMGGVKVLKADGGATANAFLMQLQADLLGVPVLAAASAESTAWGAAKLAGRAAGLWGAEADAGRRSREFKPRMPRARARAMRDSWKAALAVLLRQ